MKMNLHTIPKPPIQIQLPSKAEYKNQGQQQQQEAWPELCQAQLI